MKGFPEDIMPDGKSGIFSTTVPHKDTPGLENTADTAKETLAVTKRRPERPDACSQIFLMPVVISKNPIRAGLKKVRTRQRQA